MAINAGTGDESAAHVGTESLAHVVGSVSALVTILEITNSLPTAWSTVAPVSNTYTVDSGLIAWVQSQTAFNPAFASFDGVFTFVDYGGDLVTIAYGLASNRTGTANVTMTVTGGTGTYSWATDTQLNGTIRARTSNVATLTFPGHGLTVGMVVPITGAGGTGYDGSQTITSVTTDTFSYASTGSNESATADTGLVATPTTAGLPAYLSLSSSGVLSGNVPIGLGAATLTVIIRATDTSSPRRTGARYYSFALSQAFPPYLWYYGASFLGANDIDGTMQDGNLFISFAYPVIGVTITQVQYAKTGIASWVNQSGSYANTDAGTFPGAPPPSSVSVS